MVGRGGKKRASVKDVKAEFHLLFQFIALVRCPEIFPIMFFFRCHFSLFLFPFSLSVIASSSIHTPTVLVLMIQSLDSQLVIKA